MRTTDQIALDGAPLAGGRVVRISDITLEGDKDQTAQWVMLAAIFGLRGALIHGWSAAEGDGEAVQDVEPR